MTIRMTRRRALAATLAAPALLSGLALPRPAAAAGHAARLPESRDFTLGEFKVTTLLTGAREIEGPQGIFGMNVDADTFAAASEENFIAADRGHLFFTPTVVNTGSEVILFDTGLSADSITSALAAAGYAPEDVTHVVITHMHGDHIGGLMGAGGETFANAAYVTGRTEFDHWAAAGNDGFEGKVRPLAEKFSFLEEGGDVRSGITAVSAFGHTPGHMAFRLSSGGEDLILMADTANHHVWSLAHPDWEVRFDMDKAAAAEARRKILGMAADDRVPLVGYHLPFPALGYVERRGEGFHYIPHSYQLL